MTEPFVAQLRTRGEELVLAAPGAPVVTVRVEMPEVWDTVRVKASPSTRAVELKMAAIAALYADREPHPAFVMKLRGFEVLDEAATLAELGAVDGSIFLLTHRNRRPVR